jgi:predicted O-methyltransferase YrrM
MDWVKKIERIRSQLLNNTDPLIDHTLEEPGIYDNEKQTIKDVCSASKPPRAARFLYCLVRALKSKCVLELGTNMGISSAYLASAIEENGAGGRLVTMESSPYRQRLAAQNHERLGLNGITYVGGLFADTLNSALRGCGEIDLVFIDGHHQYKPTLDYLNQCISHVSRNCVFVFDDIRWSDGMKRAWSEIKDDPRFDLVLDLQSIGLCVHGKSGESQRVVEGPINIF